MKPGDKVIIRQNLHHTGAEDIIGTVVAFRPGEGFGGCDLVDIHYKHPKDGNGYTLPFRLSYLESADPSSLIKLAEYHETIAAKLRALVEANNSTK